MERDKIPQDKKEKFVILYDTAKKCLLILDKLYDDLANATEVTDMAKISADSSMVVKIYISALGLIDYLHRFHELVCAMPLIRQDQSELKKLKAVFESIQKCRNYLQHMRGDLKNGAINYPILGAISWIYNDHNLYALLKSINRTECARHCL